MNEFLFFAATYGVAASLAVLGVGGPFRAAGTWLDRKLFKKRWRKRKKEEAPMGGPIRVFVHCPACISFWVGFGLTFWLNPLEAFWVEIVVRLVWSFAAVGVSWVTHTAMTKLGQYQQ